MCLLLAHLVHWRCVPFFGSFRFANAADPAAQRFFFAIQLCYLALASRYSTNLSSMANEYCTVVHHPIILSGREI